MSELYVIIPINLITKFSYQLFESLERQSYKDFHILFLDNSLDYHVTQLINNYFLNKNVNYSIEQIDNHKFNLPNIRNLGINLSRSPYLSFCDSDDVLSDDHFEAGIKSLKSTNSDIYYTSYVNLKNNSYSLRRARKITSLLDLCSLNPICHSSVILRKSLNPKYNNFLMRHDLDLWINLYKKNAKFTFNTDYKVIRNLHKNNHTNNLLEKIIWQFKVYKIHFSTFKSIILFFLYAKSKAILYFTIVNKVDIDNFSIERINNEK